MKVTPALKQAVWKYDLDTAKQTGDTIEVTMPRGSVALYVDSQNNRICLWALVHTDATNDEVHRFRVAGTGDVIQESIVRHVGSLMMAEGALVFHVFELDQGVDLK